MGRRSNHPGHRLAAVWVAALIASAAILAILEPSVASGAPASAPSDEATQWVEILQAKQNHDEATELRLLRQLADAGVARARNDLGMMYWAGWGVPKDYAEAVKWLRLAAAQGLAAAQYNLGTILGEKGHGVPRDLAEAVKWLRLAATHDDAVASTPVSILSKPRLASITDGSSVGFCPTVAVLNKVADLTLLSMAASDSAEEYHDSDPKKSFAFMAEGFEFAKEGMAAYARDCSQIDGGTLVLVEGTAIGVGGDLALVVLENGQHGVVSTDLVDWRSVAQSQ